MSDISTENISENTNNVKEDLVEEKIEVENIPVPEVKTKRKYVKRKKVENIIETNLDPPIIKPEIIEIPKTINADYSKEDKEDKVKINRVEEAIEDVGDESFFKGGLIKPLLIAGLASASFWVNNVYSTKKRKKVEEEEEKFQQFKKKKMHFQKKKAILLPSKAKATILGFN